MEVSKTIRFEAAHRLWGYQGKCANIHGHSYVVTVTLEGRLMTNGMVVDFGTLSKILKGLINEGELCNKEVGAWDHALILEEGDPLGSLITNGIPDPEDGVDIVYMSGRPTAENMAEVLATNINLALEYEGRHNARVKRVSVQETETSVATWDVDADTE